MQFDQLQNGDTYSEQYHSLAARFAEFQTWGDIMHALSKYASVHINDLLPIPRERAAFLRQEVTKTLYRVRPSSNLAMVIDESISGIPLTRSDVFRNELAWAFSITGVALHEQRRALLIKGSLQPVERWMLINFITNRIAEDPAAAELCFHEWALTRPSMQQLLQMTQKATTQQKLEVVTVQIKKTRNATVQELEHLKAAVGAQFMKVLKNRASPEFAASTISTSDRAALYADVLQQQLLLQVRGDASNMVHLQDWFAISENSLALAGTRFVLNVENQIVDCLFHVFLTWGKGFNVELTFSADSCQKQEHKYHTTSRSFPQLQKIAAWVHQTAQA
jgi:hypothetical protein